MTSPACCAFPRACCCSASAPSRCGARAGPRAASWWRYPRRALIGVAGRGRRAAGRDAARLGYVDDARRARRRPAGPARRRARERHVHDQRRTRARGLVHPVAQRRRGDRLPRPQGPAEAGARCSPATATACCCSTAAARARARAGRTPGAGAARRTSRPRSPTCSAGRTSTPDRIGGIGLSVGGEMLIEAAAETDELAAVVSDGAGARSLQRGHGPGRAGLGKWTFGAAMSAVKTASPSPCRRARRRRRT